MYDLETSYLNDSNQNGNVLKGFEGYLAPTKQQKCAAPIPSSVGLDTWNALGFGCRRTFATVSPMTKDLQRHLVAKHARDGCALRSMKKGRSFKIEDRMFSLSSTTSQAVRTHGAPRVWD